MRLGVFYDCRKSLSVLNQNKTICEIKPKVASGQSYKGERNLFSFLDLSVASSEAPFLLGVALFKPTLAHSHTL